MNKMSTFIVKLLTLLLILTIALTSCDVIDSFLGQPDDNTNIEDNTPTDTPNDGENDTSNTPNDKEENETPEHSHSYTSVITNPTCTTEGYITYTCECGDVHTSDKVAALGHSYTDGTCTLCGESDPDYTVPGHTHSYTAIITDPTCTNDGYTTYTCECGNAYNADKVAALGHSYTDGTCTACGTVDPEYTPPVSGEFNYADVPAYTDKNYAVINGNTPYFTKDEITSDFFERYSDLDRLGRVGVAYACLGPETLPTDNRGNISYNPTGWIQNNYPANVVSTTQIYNRSHLIAWSLSGENNNEKNLMTGTPYFNQIGMQIFENQVLDYIKETGNHVMYRITPVFVGDNLLAHGVLMEGWSVEDNGDGICFCVFMYNVQPGVILEYETGNNYLPDSGEIKGNSATLVTDVSQLKAGDKIIIVSKNAEYALGDKASSGNNRVAVNIEKDGNIVYFDDTVTVITLADGKTAGTFAFSISEGYLYSASSSKNYLKTESSITDNSSWSISITASGVATIKSTGGNTRNWLRFNSSNIIFSSYSSGQQDVAIYVINN